MSPIVRTDQVSNLKRPDLPHLACPLCRAAFQEPEPPDWPDRRYRLGPEAFGAYQAHAVGAHSIDEHLAHCAEHGIPLVCDGCGYEVPPTSSGIAELRNHTCGGRCAQKTLPQDEHLVG